MKNYKYQLKCFVCQKEFSACQPNQKVCSSECRKKHSLKYWHFNDEYKHLTSSTVGAIAEIVVAIDLMKKGFSVFRGLSPSCYCDLIAVETKTKKKLELEVRTGRRSFSGKLEFPTILSKHNNGNITGYAVMERHNEKIYYFDLNKKEIKI